MLEPTNGSVATGAPQPLRRGWLGRSGRAVSDRPIDWYAVGHLVRVNLKRDFRTAGPPGLAVKPDGIPAIVLVVLQFLAMSTLVSLYNFVAPFLPTANTGIEPTVTMTATAPVDVQNAGWGARVVFDVPTFAFLMLSMSMVMTTLSVIGEFASVVIHPDDNEILGHRPISGRTYFTGRVISLSIYVALISLALTLPPAILGMFIAGSSWRFLPAFLFAGMLANFTAAGFVLAAYSLLIRLVSGQRLQDFVAYSHMSFIFIVFIGFQLVNQLSNYSYQFILGGGADLLTPLPGTWFSMIVTFLTWEQGYVSFWSYPYQVYAAIAAGLLAPLIMLGPVQRLSLDYADYLGRLASVGRGRGGTGVGPSLVQRTIDLFLPRDERAGFFFAWAYIRCDRQFQIRFYPPFAMPLAFIAVGLFTNALANPLLATIDTVQSVGYSMALTGIMSFAVVASLSLVPFSEHANASWVYGVTPLASPVAFVNGVKKAIAYLYFLPMHLLVYGFVAWYWDAPMYAAIHVLIGWGFTLCMLHLASAHMLEEMPFTTQPVRGGAQTRLFHWLMRLMLIALMFWILVFFAYGDARITAGVLVGVYLLALTLKRYSDRRMTTNLKGWGAGIGR